jgi:general secretion pathway protein G
MMSSSRRRARSGFTFLEIMFVVVIIGILLALVGPRLAGRTNTARIEATRAQLTNLETSLKTFEMDLGRWPATLDEMAKDPDDVDDKSYRGPYMEKIPQDSWGQDFIYKVGKDAEHNKRSYDLSSMGPDKLAGGEDDITNWEGKK